MFADFHPDYVFLSDPNFFFGISSPLAEGILVRYRYGNDIFLNVSGLGDEWTAPQAGWAELFGEGVSYLAGVYDSPKLREK